jgi:Spy/CpxP family protein refolding chaperone
MQEVETNHDEQETMDDRRRRSGSVGGTMAFARRLRRTCPGGPGGGPGMGPGMGPGGGMMGRMLGTALGLTDAQKAQAEEIRLAAHTATSPT